MDLETLKFSITDEDLALKVHFDDLKAEEKRIQDREDRIERERLTHVKEMRRLAAQQRSQFAYLPTFENRYLLTALLGKGGFSEVWKAFDLQEMGHVALKIHQMNNEWSDEKKQNYIKHVTREYSIIKGLKHDRMVMFSDVFEINAFTFATVLEICEGGDLDELLKKENFLSEKRAKCILVQILAGLRYLNIPRRTQNERGEEVMRTVIHYDLKPGNILFDGLDDVKITDFGLSKVVDTPVPPDGGSGREGSVEGKEREVDPHEDNCGSMDEEGLELTSQGAGTYWYLPPECFHMEGPVRVSSKVDVWSVGVIFYQMLFGRRPFGEGKSQENVLSQGIILKAFNVDFPANHPNKVSDEALAFIRACLTYRKEDRPSVLTLCHHPYVNS